MTTPTYEEDLLRLLLQHGKVTHIVKAGAGASMPALTLVQRCMSANIAQVVPLTEASAAVFTPGGIPQTLRVFGIEAEKVNPADYGFVPTSDRSHMTATLDELEELLSDEPVPEPAPVAAPHVGGAAAGGADDGLRDRIENLAASVSTLTQKLDAPNDDLSADLAGLAGMIAELSGRIDVIAAGRTAAEDERLVEALDRLESLAARFDREPPAEAPARDPATETVLGRLAAALEAVAPRDPADPMPVLDTILREIGEVASQQSLTLRQLATLIDREDTGGNPELEELLADLRLAISEFPAGRETAADASTTGRADLEAPKAGAEAAGFSADRDLDPAGEDRASARQIPPQEALRSADAA